MQVKDPIFIIGAGRSGSSIFHRMFCTHPNVAWLSRWHAKYSSNLEKIKYLIYMGDLPIVGWKLRKYVDPSECYQLWEQMCPGFSLTCRDLNADDVTNKNKLRIQTMLSRVLTEKKHRLLIKLTGWPRISFIREIFPDAKFIHLVRDGRAVSNSTLHVDFWWGWRGPEGWRWGELSDKNKAAWKKHNYSFVALAGIQWKILMESMEVARNQVDSKDFLEVKYEDFCDDPINGFKKVANFCELEWTKDFERNLNHFTLASQDFKWKEQMTVKQINILADLLDEHLTRYGYEQVNRIQK